MKKRPQAYDSQEWERQLSYMNPLSPANIRKFFARTERDPIWKEISKFTKPGQRGLDAGCGLGQWVYFLHKKGYAVVGVDYSFGMLKACGERFPGCEFVTGNIIRMPFPDNTFDFVVSWGVIEHDPEGPSQAIREFRRILEPSGLCFLTVPLDTPLQRWSHSIQYGDDDAGEFFEYFFTPEDMKDLVEQNGLRCRLAIPIAKHYAVLFPRQYMKAARNPGFPQNIISRFLDFAAKTTKKSYSMLFVLCEKDGTFEKSD